MASTTPTGSKTHQTRTTTAIPESSGADARKLLEVIRRTDFADRVSAQSVAEAYAVQRDKQYEVDRAPVQALLRELVDKAVEESQ